MAKNKGNRIIISLECSEGKSIEKKAHSRVFRYTTTKNKRNTSNRLELKKYCKYCKTHTVHREVK
uniref:Large ribosomal subunit protein bL33c n=1 Tax=Olisthodiscus luteus TaxID=83000 RepID=A0A7U0KSY8_OLILU|nr:ribosomal protein L33 [Olisthodiscus luteus]QQW50553.1 ribosomal protein L33 [Olisthodiscus luteus]